jgi:phosphate transport system permease protein
MTSLFSDTWPTGETAPLPVPKRLLTTRSPSDRAYRGLARAAGFGSLIILVLVGVFLFIRALPAFQTMGWAFFTTTGFVTNGPHPKFGVEAVLYGTVVIALIGLVVAVPLAIASALCINEYIPVKLFGRIPLRAFFISLIDLMAAVPSVIYALWGFDVLQPHEASVARWMSDHLGFIPLFHSTTPIFTSSFLIAGTLVGIMVIPIIASLSREVLSLAPIGEREAAMSLGARKSTVIRRVVLPFGKGGVIGAVMLGLGRALGDTIAVVVIISPIFVLSPHLLQAGGSSIAALIALRFGSGGALGLAALLACGLVLFVVTLLVNVAAQWVVARTRRKVPA